ncbi:very-short-patch-repair endonuclease [Agromyces hippuratus]|uniref:Very-short-patch-repair endonuclease n=1 Tax=Agromyces hippuratus TaxID=286438 RepID=A0A852WSC3_9MICO|nr:DUF559 domain-containing protein [Agromyces hippuratus]NYG20816.1 very-short-patch-repair endonuclease [Agromyces hippuratus]
MDLAEWVAGSNDIRHVDDALRDGFTRYAIRTAVASGEVRRVRRWLVRATAPPRLIRAAQVGGRVACVSAAQHHGLWTIDDGRLHLAVSPNASRFDAGAAIVHWNAGPVAPHRYELVEPVVNALVHLADCRPFDQALATWESALRSGRVASDHLDRLPLRSAAARRVRSGASMLSDSGIETIPVARLRRLGIRVRQQVMIDGHPVDGLIGDRLVYQVDGYEFHSSAEQRRRDIAQDRRLTLMGYTVVRIDYRQVLFEWQEVESEFRHAIAMGLDRDSGVRTRLRRQPSRSS